MGKRQTVQVPNEEILRQKEFLQIIKTQNEGKVRKYNIQTFGCQMNENDSERLSGMLAEMGYVETENTKECDLIIFNTCCVRENAELKVYGHLGALKDLKRENPELIIAVCGCMMQQQEVVDFIRKSFRQVGLIFGTHNTYKFPELLYTAFQENKTIVDIWESTGSIAEDMPIERKDGVKAWVTVMYGCNNFCSYCIVPYVRGRERSRQMSEIIKELTFLGQQGYKEVTLLGQNVNSYGIDLGDGTTFADLLKELNKIEGIERIRFFTSHPKDLSNELIQAIKECEKVCKHLHLPVQSGSTRVLDEMNRKYSKEKYLDLINKIKSEVPGIVLSTDIIVGFPGETEEDFEETLDVIAKAKFDMAYTFLYSKRTGTPASKNPDQVPEDVKKQRFQRLVNLQNSIVKELNNELLGKEAKVLVEGLSKNSEEYFTGRTDSNKVVNFKGNAGQVGQIVNIKIEKVQTWSLEGRVVD